MYSAKPFVLLWLCLLLVSAQIVLAQTRPAAPAPAQTGTATITGHVAVENSALAGLTVTLQRVPDKPIVLTQAPPLTAITDADGNYRFNNVPASKYVVNVYAPVYVVERQEGAGSSSFDVAVEDGANIQNLDFKLTRGGVITGKVTDPEGHPLIEEAITVRRLNEQGKPAPENAPNPVALLTGGLTRRTDDRGVYRIFGLRPGRYFVSAGSSAGVLGGLLGSKPEFKTTFYPGTANEAEARFVEVQVGAEAENIDFSLVRAEAKKGYVASGRVVEADTGKPVAGMMLFYGANGTKAASTGMGMSNATTNSQGEFRFENLAPGSYTVTVANIAAFGTGGGNEFYAEPLPFEISNTDAAGLILKMNRGTTISGVVVLEGVRDPQAAGKLAGLMVMGNAVLDKRDAAADSLSALSGMAMATSNPDGTFQLKGVRPGKYHLIAQSLMDKSLTQVRVEQNGALVEAVEVSGVTPVTNVRLVMGIGSATVSGRVEVRGGALPPGAVVMVNARDVSSTGATGKTGLARVDVSGKFTLDGLVPGTYEISVISIRLPNKQEVPFEAAKQTLTLGDKARQEIVLYVDLKEKEKE